MSSVSYPQLLQAAQPEIIGDDRTHRRALRTIELLLAKSRLNAAEQKLLDLLGKLANDYEEAILPTPKVSPARMLAHLIDARGVSQAELARKLGVARSTLSEALKGTRGISVQNAFRLGEYFHVEPSLFLTPSADG